MDTDRLRYFCLIAETGSLTKASELLNISHSGLSKAMSQLQLEIDQTLFRPQGRGLELTEAGKALYGKSKEILGLVERLKTQEVAATNQTLRLGMSEVFVLGLASEFAKDLDATIDIHDLDSGEIEVKLLDSQIDFAISSVPFPHPQLDYLKIAKASMGIFYRNREFRALPLEEIPFVGPNSEIRNNPLSIRSRDGWPEQQKRTLSYGASTLSAALSIVDSGRAAVFVPRFLVNALNEQRSSQHQLLEYETSRSLFKSATRDIYLMKRKNLDESKAMKTVARILRKRC
jgi:DNA-binding transcriptional LysR family regulator